MENLVVKEIKVVLVSEVNLVPKVLVVLKVDLVLL